MYRVTCNKDNKIYIVPGEDIPGNPAVFKDSLVRLQSRIMEYDYIVGVCIKVVGGELELLGVLEKHGVGDCGCDNCFMGYIRGCVMPIVLANEPESRIYAPKLVDRLNSPTKYFQSF